MSKLYSLIAFPKGRVEICHDFGHTASFEKLLFMFKLIIITIVISHQGAYQRFAFLPSLTARIFHNGSIFSILNVESFL